MLVFKAITVRPREIQLDVYIQKLSFNKIKISNTSNIKARIDPGNIVPEFLRDTKTQLRLSHRNHQAPIAKNTILKDTPTALT